MKSRLPTEIVKRKKIQLKSAKTDLKFGCNPNERPIKTLLNCGIINICKPKGPTSHQVAHYLKKILNVSKAGHSGTLDPGVTGVLPIAIGSATRITQALLPAGKEYVTLMKLHADVDEKKLREIIQDFLGKIKQKPPVKSAVKRVTRIREIYYAEILEIDKRDILVKLGCQGGTYIRKWVHDVGIALGCGANMAMLVRTKAGPFQYEDMFTLQDVKDALWYLKEKNAEKYIRKIIRPIEEAVKLLPKIHVLDSTIEGLTHGHDLAIPGISIFEDGFLCGDVVAVLSLKGELVFIGPAIMDSKNLKRKKKGYVVRTHKVFMNSGTYPRIKNYN